MVSAFQSTVKTLWGHCGSTEGEHCEGSIMGALGEHYKREHCASLTLWRLLDFFSWQMGVDMQPEFKSFTNQSWEATCILLLAAMAKYQILRPRRRRSCVSAHRMSEPSSFLAPSSLGRCSTKSLWSTCHFPKHFPISSVLHLCVLEISFLSWMRFHRFQDFVQMLTSV